MMPKILIILFIFMSLFYYNNSHAIEAIPFELNWGDDINRVKELLYKYGNKKIDLKVQKIEDIDHIQTDIDIDGVIYDLSCDLDNYGLYEVSITDIDFDNQLHIPIRNLNIAEKYLSEIKKNKNYKLYDIFTDKTNKNDINSYEYISNKSKICITVGKLYNNNMISISWIKPSKNHIH